jgi:mono/diheme cytochrome c family protein
MQGTAISVVVAATMVASGSALAQEADNVGHGRQIAQTICVACHIVARDQRVSPNSEARRSHNLVIYFQYLP